MLQGIKMEKSTVEEINAFKESLRRSIFSDSIDQIPAENFRKIYEKNFNGDLELSNQIIYDRVEEMDLSSINSEFSKIHNYKASIEKTLNYIKNKKPIVFITDFDNDGSLSQSILLELKRLIPEETSHIHIIYAQELNGNNERGITVDVVARWALDNNVRLSDDFLIVTADNGVNSRVEVEKITDAFINSHLIIGDHHNPENGMVVVETDRVMHFNPKVNPTEYFGGEKNISGAHVISILCKGVLESLSPQYDSSTLNTLEKASNLLDYVNTDIRVKPLDNSTIDTFSSLGTLMNVNNSISMLIVKEMTQEKINIIENSIKGINIDDFLNIILEIKKENVRASKLLQISADLELRSHDDKISLNADEFYSHYLNMITSDRSFEHFNNNYIEQLRPIIFHKMALKNKGSYEVAMVEKMTDVFSNLKYLEKKIINHLKDSDLMHVINKKNVTIMYPKNPDLMTIFNGKFFSKAFSLANPGLSLFITNIKDLRCNGSARSLYDLSEIFKNLKTLDGVNAYSKGHEKAAGLFLETNGMTIVEAIEKFADYADVEIENIIQNTPNENQYVFTDFHNLNMISKLNNKVRANLNNVEGISPVIKLNRSLFFKDPNTLESVSIGKMLKKSKFGYTVVSINYQGDIVIIPTEVVRNLSDNNFKDFLQLTYLSDGKYIANKVIPAVSVKKKNIVRLESPQKEKQEKIIDDYKKDFYDKDTFIKKVSRSELIESNFFSKSKDPDGEFSDWEDTVIKIIDDYDLDMFVSYDYEATGLSFADATNLGLAVFTIKEGSGKVYTEDEWSEIQSNSVKKSIFDKNLRNIKYDSASKTFIVNREIESSLISALFHERYIKVPISNAHLTGIPQSTLNKYGVKLADMDNFVSNFLKGLRVMFQAHNEKYDGDIGRMNHPKFSAILEKSLKLDSAIYSKSELLGYNAAEISTLGKNWNRTFFFDDRYVEYSLTKVLKSDGDFVFPDMRSEYCLKRVNEDYFLMNLKNNTETQINMTTSELLENKKRGKITSTYVKFSAQDVLMQRDIKNILLDDVDVNVSRIDTPDILKDYSELFQSYCKNYSFDRGPIDNLKSFESLMIRNGNATDINVINSRKDANVVDQDGVLVMAGEDPLMSTYSVGELFVREARALIENNIELYEKFYSSWEYKKVLSVYEPNTREISDNQLHYIHKETFLPKERVQKIINKICDYKEKYGIMGSALSVELHCNIGLDGDAPLEANFLKILKDSAGEMLHSVVRENVITSTRKTIDSHALLRLPFDRFAFSSKLIEQTGIKRDSQGVISTSFLDSQKVDNRVKIKSKLLADYVYIFADKEPENYNQEKYNESKRKIEFIISMRSMKVSPRNFSFEKLYEKLSHMEKEDKILLMNDAFEDYKEATKSIDSLYERCELLEERYLADLREDFGNLYISNEEGEMKKTFDKYWVRICSNIVNEKKPKKPDFFFESHRQLHLEVLDKYEVLAKEMKIKDYEEVIKQLRSEVAEYEECAITDPFLRIVKKSNISKFLSEGGAIKIVDVALTMEVISNGKDKLLLENLPNAECYKKNKSPIGTDFNNGAVLAAEIKKAITKSNKIAKDRKGNGADSSTVKLAKTKVKK